MLNQADITLTNLFSAEESEELFNSLEKAIQWQQKTIKLYGKTFNVPRLTAWFGTEGYTYSGIFHPATALPAAIEKIKTAVEAEAGQTFNSVLCNLYLDGSHSVSWHSDDEPELGADPVIASVSLGGSRAFSMKHKTDKSDKVKLELESGSLLIMGKGTQPNYLHSVPKTKKTVAPRINLTFRTIGQP